MPSLRRLLFALALVTIGQATASAQVFGTFPWQMQPYCNVITLSLINSATGFTLEGVDDQCGATNKGSAVGTASFSGSGNVTLNFTIVTAPAGKPVHVSAVVSPANGNGTWTDSLGNSGTFAFFAAVPALPARPSSADVQFRAVAHAQISVPNATLTDITGWSTFYNDGGGTYTPGTGVYVVPSTGLYQISSTIRWRTFTATGGGFAGLYAVINNSFEDTTSIFPDTSANDFHLHQLVATRKLSAGDAVKIQVYQITGVTQTVGPGSPNQSSFTVTRLR
jgi:hypothetical protein